MKSMMIASIAGLVMTATAVSGLTTTGTQPPESSCPTASSGGLDMTINFFRSLEGEEKKWTVEFTLSGNDFTKKGTQGISFYNPASAVGSYFLLPFGEFYENVRIQHKEAGNTLIPLNKTSTSLNGTTSHQWTMSPEAAAHYCTGTPGKCSVLYWTVNISDSMAKLSSIGQLVASTHAYDNHILLSGYSTFLVPRSYEMCELTIVYISSPSFAANWVTRQPHLPANPTFFQVMDAPLLLANPQVLAEFPIVPNQTLYTISEKSAAVAKTVAPMQARLQTAVRQATMGLTLAGLWDEEIPFHVFWELTKPAKANGWAMEHNSCFQAMDNTTAHWDPWLLEDYQASHHMTHARFIPRRLYTDVLEPWSQIQGHKSGFVFFSEGWAQYAAYTFLGHAGFHTTEEILLSFCQRFAPMPHFQGPQVKAMNISLYDLSKLQYTNQSLWWYNFAAGALVALTVDCENEGNLVPALIKLRYQQKTQFPNGLPEDPSQFVNTFESHAQGMIHNMTRVFDAHVWKNGGIIEDVPGLLLKCIGVGMNPVSGAFTVYNATHGAAHVTPLVEKMRRAFTP